MNRIAVPLCLVCLLAACGGDGDTPSRRRPPTQFVARANQELREIGKEFAQAVLGPAHLHHAGHRGARREGLRALPGGLREAHRRVKGTRGREDVARIRARDRTPEAWPRRAGAGRPGEAHRARRARDPHDLDVRRGQVVPEGPGQLPEHRRHLEDARDEPRLRRRARGLEGLAHDLPADAQGLPALRRARERGREGLGFKDLGELWRAGYDMTPAEFEKETDRLWTQVKPLYDGLHCYARGKLQEKYGKERVPDGKPIPAHLFGNIWAQQWNNIYDLLEPYPGVSNLDVTAALEKQKLRRRAHDEIGGVVLHVARLRGAAADVLGTLDADAAAGPRRRLPCERARHRRARATSASRPCIAADRGGALHALPRARPHLL